MENKCDSCIHNEVCDHNRFGFKICGHYEKSRKQYARDYSKRYYTERKANHQCVICGCELPEDAKILRCENCQKKTKEKQRQERTRKKANGLCVRCGKSFTDRKGRATCKECRIKEKMNRFKRGECEG